MGQILTPFDLERALAGDPVQTRGGIRAEQLFHFDKVICENERVAAVIEGVLQTYYENGKMFETKESPLDLFMAPKVREYWVNVYKSSINGSIWVSISFSSKDEAEKHNAVYGNYKLATVKIYEENI